MNREFLKHNRKKIFWYGFTGIIFGLVHFLLFNWQPFGEFADVIEDQWLKWSVGGYILPFVIVTTFLLLIQLAPLKWLSTYFAEKELVFPIFSFLVNHLTFFLIYLLHPFAPIYFMVFFLIGLFNYSLWFLISFIPSFLFVYFLFFKGEDRSKKFKDALTMAFVMAIFPASIAGIFYFG